MADPGYASGGIREPETSEESLLLSRLKRVEANPAGFFAIHIHLSQLRASNRQPHFITIAVRTFVVHQIQQSQDQFHRLAVSLHNPGATRRLSIAPVIPCQPLHPYQDVRLQVRRDRLPSEAY